MTALTFDEFRADFQRSEDEIARLLPPTLDRQLFVSCAIAAVKGNAMLLGCTRRSLSIAITRAAQDGLLPDGRLAVIIPTKDAEKGLTATYIPMYQGIIQRAYELGDIAIRAKIVCEHDTFDYDEGDMERLVHKRNFRKPRGDIIAAYAIFQRGERITHREVMSVPEIEKVRSVSRAKNGPWVTWYEEMAKKTAIRKGSKQVAFASHDLRRIVERDDELADLDQTPHTTAALTMPLTGPLPIGGEDVARFSRAPSDSAPQSRPEGAGFPARVAAGFDAPGGRLPAGESPGAKQRRNVLEEGFGPLPDAARSAAEGAIVRRIT